MCDIVVLGVRRMLEVKHTNLKVTGKYRCIVVSDIHSHLDRFKTLLKKVNYSYDDYLIILGDFVEKGNQTLEMITFLKELQEKSERVYVILGNCEYAIEELVNNPKYADNLINYIRKIGKGGMIQQAIKQLEIDIKTEIPATIQTKVKYFLAPYFTYLRTLPTTLQFNNFIFVHAGIENRIDWQNSSISSLIEMKTFYEEGHCLNKYVVVGHIPTSNHHCHEINNDIIIDHQKRIICIDGGTGVKSVSQLNALIINGVDNSFELSKDFVQPLPLYQATVDVLVTNEAVNKVAWPNFEVQILETGKSFTRCRQLNTGKILKIKNQFLYERNNKWYCLDDYVDRKISLEKGTVVKLIGIYDNYAYVINGSEIGWVKFRYLKKV